MPYSPFNNTTKSFRKKLTWISGIFTFLLIVIMKLLDSYLITDGTSDGIVSFELAKNIHDARIMMDMWGDTGRVVAGFSLGLDYLFLISYSLFLGLISFYFAKKFDGRLKILAKLGYAFSWLIFLAAVYDAIENFALFKILTGSGTSLWAVTAWFFASFKFLIVFIVLIYIVLSLIFSVLFPAPTTKNPH